MTDVTKTSGLCSYCGHAWDDHEAEYRRVSTPVGFFGDGFEHYAVRHHPACRQCGCGRIPPQSEHRWGEA